MRFAYTTLFSKSYGNLTKAEKARINTSITKLAKQPYAPFPKGLRVHKLKGVKGTAIGLQEKSPDVWEMHANGPLIITFQYGEGEIIFRNCGNHRDVLQSP